MIERVGKNVEFREQTKIQFINVYGENCINTFGLRFGHGP